MNIINNNFNLKAARLIFLFLLIFVFLLIFHKQNLTAEPKVPIEVGVSYSIGKRADDKFSRGMKKFRSSVDPTIVRNTEVDPFSKMDTIEYYLRAGVLDSERHLIGLAVGKYIIADVPLTEVRNDNVITQTDWSFKFPYLLFTYHYTGHIPGRWNRKLRLEWDGGAGFGFLFGPKWQVKGYSVSKLQTLGYDSTQRGRTGNIYRLELGLRRKLWGGMYLRAGLRTSFLHVGTWNGELNNSDGSFYYSRDGSLIPLSSLNLLTFQSVTLPNAQSTEGASLIESKAIHKSGVYELQFSVGYRW